MSKTVKIQILFACSPSWKIHEQFLGWCRQDNLVRERVEWTVLSPEEVNLEALSRAEVVVCGRFPREWLPHCTRLRWI